MTLPPHAADRAAVTIRRGNFFLPGARHDGPGDRGLVDSAYVEWESPVEPTGVPLVLVHGGGGQSTDWRDTPDGRPGWIDVFVAAGHPVYLFDRPGHGRSSRVLSGDTTTLPPMGFDFAIGLWAPPEEADQHSRWIGGREPGDPVVDQLVAAAGAIRVDGASSETAEARRLADLLDMVGDAVIVTHSAGAPAGWIAATLRPGSVRAIVAVEPIGPPFSEFPGLGRLEWGLSRAPIAYEPPVDDPSVLRVGTGRSIPGLSGLPVVVVSGGASRIGRAAPAVVDYLREVGAEAELLALDEAGIRGNGHGLLFESNSDETAGVVLDWVSRHASASAGHTP